MKKKEKLLAVIPARGGSKGLPGKNIRPFAGHPLIAHSILMARMTSEIDRIVVTTDDPKIAKVAADYDIEIPFMRPKELAGDDTPMWLVVKHALREIESIEKQNYDYVLLLDPTSPGRTPEDIQGALQKLKENKKADGIIGVSKPDFSPIWHSVVEKEGWMADLIHAGEKYSRRQDVPTVYRINASLYIWRADFVKKCREQWRQEGQHLLFEIPETRAIHIDELYEFEKAELCVKNNLISFPWL